MKKLAAHIAVTPRMLRGFSQLLLAVLFMLAVFELSHLPAIASHSFIDLWRGVIAGSLFLFFCFPGSQRPPSGP